MVIDSVDWLEPLVWGKACRDNDVNGNWIPDSHRLNFKYLQDEHRLLHPSVDGHRMPWAESISAAISSLKAAGPLAMVLSARLTNEELYLAQLLSTSLKVSIHDVVPRIGEPRPLAASGSRPHHAADGHRFAPHRGCT
ncbi:MAG: hypothetical protein EBR23_15835 [Planctomycetia bacterium]|nr:hypothetical protein [Planctomycetia bacterium]